MSANFVVCVGGKTLNGKDTGLFLKKLGNGRHGFSLSFLFGQDTAVFWFFQ